MKIIFLDIDGVISTEKSHYALILSFLFGVIEIRGIFAALHILRGRRLSALCRHFLCL